MTSPSRGAPSQRCHHRRQ